MNGRYDYHIPHNLNLPIAPPGALFVGTLGRILIWAGFFAFLTGLLQSLFFRKGEKIGSAAAIVGALGVIGAFITLGYLLVHDQFEFHYVWEHSDSALPLQYKIAAIWSGQEGSFLLWATTSSIFLLLTLWSTGVYRRWFSAVYFVFLAALCGILAYESPFDIQRFNGFAYLLPHGNDLNASLKNYWVVIHPPTIFTGFGSLTVLFAYGASAMITRNYKDWVPLLRPWALVSLSIVGIGLCMGGFWAYETLGWGGFWKWDPVENVSFVPWIMTAVLVHGLIMQSTKGRWLLSNVLFAGLPFLFYTYGTFLTRAGFLDGASVHSFASMEHTAHMVLLTFCIAAWLGFLALWLYRILASPPSSPPQSAATGGESPAGNLVARFFLSDTTHREGWYRFGNLMLALIGVATAIGMSVPLVQYVMHKPPKAVDEHLYHLVLSWFFVPVMICMAVAPFVSWRRMSLWKLLERIFNVFSITIGILGISMIIMNHPTMGVHLIPHSTIDFPFGWKVPAMPWIMLLVGFCIFTVVGNLWRIVEMRKARKSSLGSFIAHIGVAVAMAGLIVSRGLERTQFYALQEQDIAAPLANVNEAGDMVGGNILPYTLTLHDVDTAGLSNPDNKLSIDVRGDGDSFVAKPGFYFRKEGEEQKQTAWPSIQHTFSHDTYLALGAQQVQASDPITLAPGATQLVKLDDPQTMDKIPYQLTYKKMEMVGQPGQEGTKFLADVLVRGPNGAEITVKPSMQIAAGDAPDIEPAIIDSDFFLTMMSMDAATKDVTLQVNYVRPLYLVNLIYKPLVMLVPLGALTMMIGGLMSAWYRRNPKKAGSGPTELPSDPDGAAR